MTDTTLSKFHRKYQWNKPMNQKSTMKAYSDQLCEEITETIDFMFKTKVHEFHFAPFLIDALVAILVNRI